MTEGSNGYTALAVSIAGTGCYVPERVVGNATLEQQCGVPEGWCRQELGIEARHWIAEETHSFMGAEAAREALAAAALEPSDIELIVNASVSFERMIPDGGPLLQHQLGMADSGIPSLTVNAGDLSFPVAMETVALLMAAHQYRNVLIVSSEVMSRILDPSHPEAFMTFADGAAAVVLTITPQGACSAIAGADYQTFGEGEDWLYASLGQTLARQQSVTAADMALKADLTAMQAHLGRHLKPLLDKMSDGDAANGPDLVIPQQWRRVMEPCLDGYVSDAKIAWIDRTLGFPAAAAMPMALHQAVRSGRLKRGDNGLFLGFGAGFSIGALLFRY